MSEEGFITKQEFEVWKKSTDEKMEKMDKTIKTMKKTSVVEKKKDRPKKEPSDYNNFMKEELSKEEYKLIKPQDRFKACSEAWNKRKNDVVEES